MKMDVVAGSGNDEFYTPPYAIKPIAKHLAPASTIWCPFDDERSNFVKVLRAAGHAVTPTHLATDVDFFTAEPPAGCDYIVSNPPYSCKGDVLDRLFGLGVPFAMLVGVVGLFESRKRFDMFRANRFEIMYLSGRVAYFKDFADEKPSLNPPFSSVYVCQGVLPDRIVFEAIDKSDVVAPVAPPTLLHDVPPWEREEAA